MHYHDDAINQVGIDCRNEFWKRLADYQRDRYVRLYQMANWITPFISFPLRGVPELYKWFYFNDKKQCEEILKL
jgi:hypothetical protein